MSNVKVVDVGAIYLRFDSIRERTDSSRDSLIIRVTSDTGLDIPRSYLSRGFGRFVGLPP